MILGQTTIGDDELYDIIVPTPKESVWPLFLFWILVGLVLAGAVIGLVIYLFLRKSRKTITKSPGKIASSRLTAIERRRDELEVGPYTMALSETLKDYLSEKFGDPVRFETSQEFLKRISGQGSNLPGAAQQELATFLTESEELKFGNLSEASDRKQPLARRVENVLNLCESVSTEKL